MGLLDQHTRVQVTPVDWVEIKPLSVGELRLMRSQAQDVQPLPGEEQTEAQGYQLTKAALEACIVAWSDEAPVTPENIARLPYKITIIIANAIGLGSEEGPLPDGSASTST